MGPPRPPKSTLHFVSENPWVALGKVVEATDR